MQPLSLGRIVLVCSPNGRPYPGIVQTVHSPTCADIEVFVGADAAAARQLGCELVPKQRSVLVTNCFLSDAEGGHDVWSEWPPHVGADDGHLALTPVAEAVVAASDQPEAAVTDEAPERPATPVSVEPQDPAAAPADDGNSGNEEPPQQPPREDGATA